MRKRNVNRIIGLKEATLTDIIYLLFVILIVTAVGTNATQKEVRLISPIPQVNAASSIETIATPTLTPPPFTKPQIDTPEKKVIADYIKEVFGDDTDKAFDLLSCENSSLDPDAVNTAGNFPVGSRDIGVFQINEFWQKVNARFLFNWKINVQIAYQIFSENDNTFKMWSCGQRLGI